MYGILPLSASIQFEDKGVLYKERLFISVDREDNGKHIKETYRYGLINHIKGIIDGIMSV